MKSHIFLTGLYFFALAFLQMNSAADVKHLFSDSKLNVHICPHTHDDPGWLKTADQYFYGSNTSIYKAGVQYILDTVVVELENDPKKHFVYVEMSFFQRWYFEQDEQKKQSVKSLVANGQLSFANGGWVMHDEAGAHYVSMIDQTTLGHRFLVEEFGYTPRVGWQIDPFGHSATQPTLLSSDVGFDALYFGRIDYEDLQLRKDNKNLEFIWRSMNSNPNSQVFTGVFSDGNYGMPRGFNFDVGSDDQPVCDDPNLEEYNVDQMVEDFANAILTEHGYAQGNHIMLKMGSDFHYTSAHHWYKNLDKLIKHVNEKDDRFNLFYSDPTSYTDARAQEKLTWSVKTDDFFPYADCEHCYWGGYFTSRPTLKYIERTASRFLQVLKQSSAFNPHEMSKDERKALFGLTAAVGLVNHHDAITGTSKQHVADDYMKILDRAFSAAERVVSDKVTELSLPNAAESGVSLGVCRQANASLCDLTQTVSVGDSIIVVAYNALPRQVSQQVNVYLPNIAESTSISVYEIDADGNRQAISSEIIPTSPRNSLEVAVNTLVFTASDVQALFFSRFVVEIGNVATRSTSSSPKNENGGDNLKLTATKHAATLHRSNADPLVVENDKVQLTFTNGLLSDMKRLDTGLSCQVSNNLYYYVGYGSPSQAGFKYPKKDLRDPHVQNLQPSESAALSSGDASTQASGAYIFRPQQADGGDLTGIAKANQVDVSVVQGDKIVEVRQQFADWASQVVRLRDGSALVELEWTVGPIPIDDHKGKEVISRFDSDLNSQDYIYTDANGREFQERLKNYRPTWDLRSGQGESEPVGGNYYPITAAAYLRDTEKGAQLTILTDRAQGAASLSSGQLELMIHRRLLADDGRGVGEPLNETVGGIEPHPDYTRHGEGITVSGVHYLLLSDLESGLRETRTMMDRVYQPLHAFYTVPTTNDFTVPAIKDLSPISGSLPENVQLLTLETWNPNTLLVRLAHQFAVDEDETMSTPVTVDLGALLQPMNPTSITEMGLSANQEKASMVEKKIQWQTSGYHSDASSPQITGSDDLIITVNPMEIKTFFVQLSQ